MGEEIVRFLNNIILTKHNAPPSPSRVLGMGRGRGWGKKKNSFVQQVRPLPTSPIPSCVGDGGGDSTILKENFSYEALCSPLSNFDEGGIGEGKGVGKKKNSVKI